MESENSQSRDSSCATSSASSSSSQTNVKFRVKNRNAKPEKVSSQEEINKRLSLPANLKLPDEFLQQILSQKEQNLDQLESKQLSRASRRQSMSEIGFGRTDTYTKLDKLGEVIN